VKQAGHTHLLPNPVFRSQQPGFRESRHRVPFLKEIVLDAKDIEHGSIPAFLRAVADAELLRLRSTLPTIPEQRFMLFLEIQRVFDVATVQQAFGRNDAQSVRHDFDILRWGMNLATCSLLAPLTAPLAIPLSRTSDEIRNAARSILWNFGAISLIRKAADMVQHGFMLADQNGENISVRDSGAGPVQYLDHVEFDRWREAEASWTRESVSPQGWTICEPEEIEANLVAPGAFWARPPKAPAHSLSREALEALMLPLIHPWTTPHGTMMGYGAREEVDEHFLLESFTRMQEFRSDAGVHPDVNFGKFTGTDVLTVLVVLLSFFHKHVIFGLLANKRFAEISMRESFTIWGPKEDLLKSVCLATRLPRRRVGAVLNVLSLTPNDVGRLENEATPILPMLIDLGNGIYLKPISSLVKNPLAAFQRICQWRIPSTRNAVSASREAWFREELYSVFGGARYVCVPGNIVLRAGKRRLTDVDAVVFDRTTGELGLFQLKWQDYSTNSVRELRSKAHNLSEEVDTWGNRVIEWVSALKAGEISQALRLKLRGSERVTSVLLFAVSRSVARTHGYGFPMTCARISAGSWPQFRRIRGQIGPAPEVLSRIHERLRAEQGLTLTTARPHPFTLVIPGLRLDFRDLWNTWEEGGLVGQSSTC
jgi:hypothetical protein